MRHWVRSNPMSNVVWISSARGSAPARMGRGASYMADLEFEGRLDRLFAEAPMLGDAEAFARRVQSRLDRSWTLRRLLIGGLGVFGGLIAVVQLAASGVIGRAQVLS